MRKPLANWNPFWANLQVYDYLLFDARHTKRWRDKLGVWFRRTGWRPDDVAAQYPKQRADLSTFEKFDPQIPVSHRRYVLAQFGIAVVATLGISLLYTSAGAEAVVVPCILLWALLYTLGTINEGRPWAVRAELLRLLVVVPAGLAIMVAGGHAPATAGPAIATGAYAGLSSILLLFAARQSENNVSKQILTNET